MGMQIQKLRNKPLSYYAAFLVLTLTPLYYASFQYRLVHPYGGIVPLKPDILSSTDFIREWLNTQLIAPFNPSPIAAYCNRTEWHPNLVFTLDNANGGIGNVRGNVLDFLFFAIEAGASIMLPGRAARSDSDLSNVWASRAPFDSFFDEEWFMHSMSHACRQMKIYRPDSHHAKLLTPPLPGNYLPRTRRVDSSSENTKQAYLSHLSEWLSAQPDFQPDNLTVVSLERTLWDIDTRSLPASFRRNFPLVLRINPSIRRLAAIVTLNLANTYLLPLDPRSPIPRKAYFGAHLRAAADARNAGWLEGPYSNFSAQTDAYISLALANGLRTIYVASGNSTATDLFTAKASAHNPPLNVTSKTLLLPPNEAAALRELTWDQQALVDYEVLQRSSVFSGIVKSSFAYNIAISRDQVLVDAGRAVEPWAVLKREEGVAMDDGVSRVLGRDGWHEGRIPRGMWP